MNHIRYAVGVKGERPRVLFDTAQEAQANLRPEEHVIERQYRIKDGRVTILPDRSISQVEEGEDK